MFLRVSVVTFFTVILMGCNKDLPIDKMSIQQEVKKLTTIDQQKIYLEVIYTEDQKTRTDRHALEVQHGYMSENVKEAVQKIIESDKINFMKIKEYLNIYGHPTIADHGEKASRTPFIVFHHTASIEAKEDCFELFYQAYKNGDLEAGSFSMYLNRWHTEKFGKRLSLPNPYQEEDMIKTLIEKLELQINF